MIKANELRVGNLYMHKSTVDDFKEHMIAKDLDDDWNPIPLTPEWLEKCGLPNDLSTMDAGGNYSLVFERRGDKLFLVSSSAMESEVIGQIEYLHQLQNLYFALTGTELEIKL